LSILLFHQLGSIYDLFFAIVSFDAKSSKAESSNPFLYLDPTMFYTHALFLSSVGPNHLVTSPPCDHLW